MAEAFDGEGDEVAERKGAGVLAGKAGAKVGFIGGVDGEGLISGALGFEPFEDPSVEEGTEGLHGVVGERGGTFAGGVADSIERVKTNGKEGLEGLGEEVGVGVVEEGIKAIVLSWGTGKGFEAEGLGAEIPVEVSAGTFFGGSGLCAEDADLSKGVGGVWGKGLGEGKLIGAFGIEGFEPKGISEALGGFDLGAGKEGVGGALNGEENGGGAEGLAENKRNTAGGDLGEEVATKGAGGGRHQNGGDVLEGHLTVGGAYSAVELSVLGVEFRFFEAGDFNEVIGHAGIPVRR